MSVLLACCPCALALNPSLDISQYAHKSWTVRDGFSLGNIYAMAQTPDGYLWLGTEFGLFRFDGVRTVPWQPPAGQQLPERNINSLLVSHDGTLWIGTFAGLATWSGGKLIRRTLPGGQFVASLFEDREGTVWASTLGTPNGVLCAMRTGHTQCYGENGAFGRAVWALYEDSSGTLWSAAQSGLWRMRPGSPRRYATPTELIALNKFDDGRLLIAMHGAGLMKLAGDKVESYPIRDPTSPNRLLRDHDVDSNRVLRDRDGGLWIGTVERGLIHLHHGRTDIFTKSDGLSGDVVLSLFEDREGNIWTASTGGLDRFGELPVTTVSVKQGLSSDATQSVLAATDGSIWVGAHDGLSRWKNGQITIFRKASGLPDDAPESLFQDDRGRVWVSTRHGLAYFNQGKFVAVRAVPAGEVHYISGDNTGNLWLSEHRSLLHLLEGRLVEQIPWSELGRERSAELLLCDRQRGGLWLGFWVGGGLAYFKDGRFRASYTTDDGLGGGGIPGLQIDPDGTLWAATQNGGVSRLKDGRITTLTTRNALPCNTIHWTIADDDRSFWLYTACGLVRIKRTELDAWIADPNRRIQTTVWNAADGVRLRSTAASAYGPRVTKSTDGKLWFVTGEGIQVVDPHHLAFNKVPPAVHIEQIVADHKTYDATTGRRVPALTRDLEIEYTAVSLVVPEKNRFKYKLEGYDPDWIDAGNRRQAFYTNLPPRGYTFRVKASNNSGIWNETGDALEFSVDPAFYQTNGFRALCAAAFLALLWLAYRFRVRQLARDFNLRVDERVNERTRIARELHDTLLQSLQASLLQMHTARTVLSRRPEEAGPTLDEAIETTEGAIAEGRDAIHDLRSQPAHTNLAKLLTLTGQELASEQNTEGKQAAVFRTTVEGEKRSMKPLIQDEAYRIGRELLRNAFRHADASEIEAAIRYEDRLFRLRVRDNGKGIDAKILKAGSRTGHWGLLGMRERAKRIGGQLDIWSQTGAGTEIELSIPSDIAYEAAREGRRPFALFHRKRAQS